MSEYRDIGSLLLQGLLEPYPRQDLLVDTTRKSQVYLATHNGEGQTLPYMSRSFISFTFGGRKIEEFNLLSTITGDRLNRSGYASFGDTVTSYDNLDGLHYWATHYKTNLLDFTLSTDGIDLRMLDDFLHWFKAGTVRELILAEHPNRAIMARVAQPPQLVLLPFELQVSFLISSETYTTSTTLYKGDIQLSLVMDLPHWYAIKNMLGEEVTKNNRKYYEDYWTDITTNQRVSIFASKDALKILYEDGIPLGSMIENNMLLGNGAYASVENEDEGRIWSISEEDENFIAYGETGFPGDGVGAQIVANDATSNFTGIIAGAMVDINGNGISTLGAGQSAYFFYAGTAPSPTVISFTLQPQMASEDGGYILVPYNTYNPSVALPYNSFTIESVNALTLYFTTPNLFTSYNKAVDIFNNYMTIEHSWEDIRKEIRNSVHHKAIREWAMKCIDYVSDTLISELANISDTRNAILENLSYVLKNASGDIFPATFSFNSETGAAIGTLKYRKVTASIPANDAGWATYGTDNITEVEEDVGDMLKSNYIIILDRNYPTELGKISAWQSSASGRKNSHRVIHNIDGGLTNVQILYKNMYL